MKKYIVIGVLCVLKCSLQAQFTVFDTSITHTNAALFSAVSTNDSTVFVVGGWSGIRGVILKTTNGGSSWSLTSVANCLTSVSFTSKDTGYAVGENTTIMKTIDAGTNWVYQNTSVLPPSYSCSSVCFINNDTGLVGFSNAAPYAFLKTYNGGGTWINDVSDTVLVESMFLVKPRTVFALNYELAKTNNWGASWIKHSLLPYSTGSSMYFLNDSVGFATVERWNGTPCFNYSTLLKTADGGQTWTSTDYNCGSLSTIVFPSVSTGYILGPVARRLSKTTDGGTTWNLTDEWILDSAQIANNVTGLYMICTDTNTCYIFLNDGTIVKTTNGGGADVGINKTLVNNEALNIYPNPATNQIAIEFDLSETKNAAIEIKNVLGQTVKAISNTGFLKGTNKIEIDVSDLAKGLYIVQLQNGNKLINQKFIKQ